MSWSDPKHFIFKDVRAVSQPQSGHRVIADEWWLVDADGRIAFYNPLGASGRRREPNAWGPPQCNRDKRISDLLAPKYPWAVAVQQVPMVFVPETADTREISAMFGSAS